MNCNGIVCEAGDAQIVSLADGAKADATLVVGEEYRVFAPANGILVMGYADPDTVGNITGVIAPGGWLDVKATGTALMLLCEDTTDGFGNNFDCKAYVVKISDNA